MWQLFQAIYTRKSLRLDFNKFFKIYSYIAMIYEASFSSGLKHEGMYTRLKNRHSKFTSICSYFSVP